MIVDLQRADYLKQWMVRKLKPICDADHEVLSEYIMALLKHDQPEQELVSSCLKQLEDFLQNDTQSFVTDLFDHLRLFGALNGAYQPPDLDLSTSNLIRKRSLVIDEPYLLTNPTNLNPIDHHFSPPPPSSAPIPQYTPTQSHPSFLHFPDAPANPLTPSTSNLSTSQIEPYVPSSNHSQRNFKRPRRSGICRDYHHRGYCARGNNCQFSHDQKDSTPSSSSSYSTALYSQHQSVDPIVSPLSVSCLPLAFSSSLAQQIPGLGGPLPVACSLPNSGFSSQFDQARNPRYPDRSSRQEGPPPPTKKSTTTLIIDNIPSSSLSDRAVREYFSAFGSLASVSVDVYNAQALVTFNSPEDAKRAYSSPQAVFNNRFVKIHFKRLTPYAPRRSHPLPRTKTNGVGFDRFGASHGPPTSHMDSNGYNNVPSAEPLSVPNDQSVTPFVPSPPQLSSDPQVLSQREQELRLKIDAQKRLLEELNQKKAQKQNGTPQPSRDAELNGNLRSDQSNHSTDHTKPNHDSLDGIDSTTTNMNSLSESMEGGSLGTEKNTLATRSTTTTTTTMSNSNTTSSSTSFLISRDGRKMTALPPGNARTTWTNTSNFNPTTVVTTTPKSFKLDNRSCTLAIKSIPSLEHRQIVKSYLEQFGTIISITPLNQDSESPDLCVKFSNRTAAEKVLLNGMEVPEVGKLSMSWIPVGNSTSTSATTMSTMTRTITNIKTDTDTDRIEAKAEGLNEMDSLIPGLRNSSFSEVKSTINLKENDPQVGGGEDEDVGRTKEDRLIIHPPDSNAINSTTAKTFIKPQSNKPFDSNQNHISLNHQQALFNNHDDDDLIDDFYVDDEIDGCWKR